MASETFNAIGYPASKLAVILNRSDSSGGFNKADLEQALGAKIDYEIVSDGRLVASANNEGIAFVTCAPDTPIAQGVRQHRRCDDGAAIASAVPPWPGGAARRRLATDRRLRLRRRRPDGPLRAAPPPARRAILYLGDNGRTPYGPRDRGRGAAHSPPNAWQWLLGAGRQAAGRRVQHGHLPGARRRSASRRTCPSLGVIRPGAVAVAAATRSGHVAVVATAGTVASGAYPAAISRPIARSRGDAGGWLPHPRAARRVR